MNPRYMATHHNRLAIGSPSDRLPPTQYDPDADLLSLFWGSKKEKGGKFKNAVEKLLKVLRLFCFWSCFLINFFQHVPDKCVFSQLILVAV